MSNSTVVVIGGGIAGLSCIEGLIQDYESSDPQYRRILLISDCRLVKKVANYVSSGRQLEKFDVTQNDIGDIDFDTPDGLEFSYIIGDVKRIDSNRKIIYYNQDLQLSYDILCICNGSSPRHLEYHNRGKNNEVDGRVILIRDTTTVNDLKVKLESCRRIVIVGNGGIGLELVSKISNCEKVWIIKDESIGYTFFDSGCAKFLMETATSVGKQESISNQAYFSSSEKCSGYPHFGPALGPSWVQRIELKGNDKSEHKLDVVYQDEAMDIVYSSDNEYPLRVITKKSRQIDCDLVATAIGVSPNRLEFIENHPETSSLDGGILIDNEMRTSLDFIYAAGDVVSCEKWPNNELWFQMRLWTQARQMGYYAGRCMAAHRQNRNPTLYFTFDCFTHCTTFFNLKLVLLGRYNGQCLTDKNFEVIARVNPGKDYVKILVGDNGRILGAVLAGESNLEETIENLIHDQIDISRFKNELLDDTVDIEDYFD